MNVANILLVRVTVREREMAIRASLGASRARLIRLLLMESLMLAALGTLGGLLIGHWIGQLLVESIDLGMDLPFVMDTSFDWRVFTYAGVSAVGTGLVVGALPARRASRAQIAGLLHEGGRSGSASAGRRRVRSALVVAQIAGSLVLLIVAGLFVRNLQQAQRVNLGFDPSAVVTARLDTTHIGFDREQNEAFYKDLDQRIRTIPGVVSSSMSFSVPLSWIFGGYLAHAEGQSEATSGPLPPIGCNTVTPDYFQTMKIPVVSGRTFTSQDDKDTLRVAVINDTLAERFWPKQNPIGKRIEIPLIPGPPWEVVGVVATTKYLTVFEGPLPYFYLPQAQNPSFLRSLEVRSTLPSDEMRVRLARVIGDLQPELPIADLNPLERTLRGNMGFVLFRVGALQATLMGLLGLALAVIGVYGVVSYQTAQREKEIGIRVALGAEPGDVRRLVLNQGFRLVLIGVAIGLVLTVIVTTALSRVIVLVSTTDPLTFIGVTAVLASSALAACYLPARRATRVEPVAALRQE
jgi:putative ABC transport system permease protein